MFKFSLARVLGERLSWDHKRIGEIMRSPVAPIAKKIPTVLVVCTGNTCRSPMAEAVIRARWNINTESAGLGAQPNEPAAKHTITLAKKLGVDLTFHRSRSIRDVDFSHVDLVLTMTLSQLELAHRVVPVRIPVRYLAVDDPFGQSLSVYERTLAEIEAQVKPLMEELTRS